MEVARVRAEEEQDDERQLDIGRAIKLLRKAIAELRSLYEEELHASAAGFVR